MADDQGTVTLVPSGASKQAPLPSSETTMATTVQFEPFDASTKDWDTFVSQFELYVTATKTTDPVVKKATFLSVCRKNIFNVARMLVAPAELKDTALPEITDKLCDYLTPNQS